MLQPFVIRSIDNFTTDCQHLCVKHYPAIHNQGMTAHHLGLAFAKRLCADLKNNGHQCEHMALEVTQPIEQPNHYRVSCAFGTVWIITHHFINGNAPSRQQLLTHISDWQAEYNYSIGPSDLLLVVADHWINRHKQSREMIHWWHSCQPENLSSYQQQGIKLAPSEITFSKQLTQRCKLSPHFCHYTHPLRSPMTQKTVLRYVQFFAIIHPHTSIK